MFYRSDQRGSLTRGSVAAEGGTPTLYEVPSSLFGLR